MTQSDNLQSISTRIRALLAKASDAGVTEHEALAFAAKARELMDRYQLDLTDLELREEGTARVQSPMRDPDIGTILVNPISRYCDCKGWTASRRGHVEFFGLRSDADLASWLWIALRSFVEIETLNWSLAEGGTRQDVLDFSHACARRIAERLRAAKPAPSGARGQALLVVKNQLVTEEFAKLNLHLGQRSATATRPSEAAAAGYATGARASFGRPIGHRVAGRLAAPGGAK